VGVACTDGSDVEVGTTSGITVAVGGCSLSVGWGVGVIMTGAGSPIWAAQASTTTDIKAVTLVKTNQKSTRIQRFIRLAPSCRFQCTESYHAGEKVKRGQKYYDWEAYQFWGTTINIIE
jgi:hypothetical protein